MGHPYSLQPRDLAASALPIAASSADDSCHPPHQPQQPHHSLEEQSQPHSAVSPTNNGQGRPLHSTSPLDRSTDTFKRRRRLSPSSASNGTSDEGARTHDIADDSSETEVFSTVLGPPAARQAAGSGSNSQRGGTDSPHQLIQSTASGGNLLGRLQLSDDIMVEPPAPVAPGTAERPPLEEQYRQIDAMASSATLRAGETWYVVSASWYSKWRREGKRKAAFDPDPNQVHSSQEDESAAVVGQEDEAEGPGPIDNSDLLDAATGALRLHISEDQDYQLLHSDAWQALLLWYGSKNWVFPRQVILGMGGQERIELRPPQVTLVPVASASAGSAEETTLKPVGVVVSVATTMSQFKTLVKQSFGLAAEMDEGHIRFWRLPASTEQAAHSLVALPPAQLAAEGVELVDESLATGVVGSSDDSPTLEALQMDQPTLSLAVELKGSDDNWPSSEQKVAGEATTTATPPAKGFFAKNTEDHWTSLHANPTSATATAPATASTMSNSFVADAIGRLTRSQAALDRGGSSDRPRGLIGLQNLGNTCFMNSALQCMSNTVELQQYFVSGVYKQELNTDNPLGMGGALAEAFGNLLERIWSPNAHGAVAPREFKYAVSRFAPQFAGYGQQDTQELLAFLLDGLHEDLNRILKKPYIEAPDWEGGGEKEMVDFARKQWEIYKQRNDSVIVDLFQGQYRSTLVCPVCSKVSIKFDPFMYLTLPIPNRRVWTGEINFVPYDPTKQPITLTLSVPQDASFILLKATLAEIFGTEASRLVGGEIWHGNIHKWYHDWETVTEIGRSDRAYFWELPAAFEWPPTRGGSSYIRSTMQSPESYERQTDANTKEAWALLPVFPCHQEVASEKRKYRGHSSSGFGIPFFVAIPPEQQNDAAAIERLVIEQFTRFAHTPATFAAAVSAIAAGAGSDPDAMSVAETEAVPVSAPSASETVTEIRFEDGEKEPFVTETAEASPDVAQTRSVNRVVVEAGDEEGNSAQTNGHAKSKPLQLRFGIRKTSVPMPQGAETWEDSEDFSTRQKRLTADEGSWPLVYHGGAIVAAWEPSVAERLFEKSSNGFWGEHEKIEDTSVAKAKGKAGVKRSLSIEDCMDEFTRQEQLGSDDLWYCPQCKEFRQATKKFDLWKVPDILVVHLKRFSSGRHSRDKLDDLVDFPIEGLDLSKRVEGLKVVQRLEKQGFEMPVSTSRAHTPEVGAEANDDAVAVDAPVYDLYAVDNHYGGLGGGHYTAYAKNHQSGKWYYYDDSSVRQVDPENSKTSAAYLLFYKRRTDRMIGGKTRQKLDESLNSLPDKDAAHGGAGPSNLSHETSMQPPGAFPEADASGDPFEDEGMGWNSNLHTLQLAGDRSLGNSFDELPFAGASYANAVPDLMSWPTGRRYDDSDFDLDNDSGSVQGGYSGPPSSMGGSQGADDLLALQSPPGEMSLDSGRNSIEFDGPRPQPPWLHNLASQPPSSPSLFPESASQRPYTPQEPQETLPVHMFSSSRPLSRTGSPRPPAPWQANVASWLIGRAEQHAP